MKCKTCGEVLLSLIDHSKHFDFHHRVSINSFFTCGIDDCTGTVKNLEGYELHFNVCHSKKTTVAVLEDSLLFKCPVAGCDFKSRSKATLRSHKFWHPVPEAQNVNVDPPIQTFEEQQSDDLPIEMSSCPVPNLASVDPSALEESLLAKKLTHMSLSLTSKYHVPDSTLAFVLSNYSTLLRESLTITSRRLLEMSNEADSQNIQKILSEHPLLKLHSPEGSLRSYYCRQNEYARQFPYVKPVPVSLGLNSDNVECKYHYVPIKENIKLMFSDDSVHEQYLERRNKRRSVLVSPDLTDIHSGSVYSDNELFSEDPGVSIELIFFQDDIELCKGLGAAAGSYKMWHMGFTLGNLHAWNRSKVYPLQLSILCKEKDVVYFGFPKVLEPLMKDLKDLETNGIEIRGEVLKASILVSLRDNLGTHTIGGFVESFATSHYFCRYCEESRAEWNARWNLEQTNDVSESESDSESESESDDESQDDSESSEVSIDLEESSSSDSDDDIPLADLIPLSEVKRRLSKRAPFRTIDSYDACLDQLKESPGGVKGVLGKCPLNDLKYFHIVGACPPCILHDCMEGFAKYDIYMCLESLSSKYKFTFKEVNRRIKRFKFLSTDKLDKPPAKLVKRQKDNKIRGNAVQIWTLIRFLPMLIGDKIKNKKDPAWVMILTLIEIIQLFASPVVSKSSLPYIEEQILKYLNLRCRLFKRPLRAKHHFFEHLCALIARYGPIMRSSTLRFESKHKFFRSEFCNKKCLKNPTKTITEAHQHMQSTLYIDSLFARHPILKEAVLLSGLNIDDEIMQCLNSSFGPEVASKLLYSSEVTYHNTLYQKGAIAVVSTQKYPQIECLKIHLLLSDGKIAYAIGHTCTATLMKSISLYSLSEFGSISLINLEKLKDYTPYPVYHWRHQPVIVLKHLYREM